jgi:hypothetical protein
MRWSSIRTTITTGVALAAAGAVLAAAPPALGGTVTLTFNANAGDGCSAAFQLVGGSPFGSSSGCFGFPIGISGGGSEFTSGMRTAWQTNAPPGLAINSADVDLYDADNVNDGRQWGGGSYYAGGGHQWKQGQFDEFDSGFSSGYWGFQLLCSAAHCTNFGEIDASTITLTATETQGPGLVAVGSHNLWYQGPHFVWNPPGDPWSIALSTSDPSGVCHIGATVDGTVIPGPSATPDTAVWQQCPNQVWTNGATVDTRDYVHTSGTLSLAFWATNAAGVFGASQTRLKVDNDPVSLRLGTPNDSNPSVWVGHAVKLITTAHAGPSGLGTLRCAVDGAAAKPYPSSGMMINGTGVHTASCTATNRAVDPQGAPASATSSEAIKIDETPPQVQFEPTNPSTPTRLIVDTSDGQSGVSGGTIAMRPVSGSDWHALRTGFDGRHLIASFDDAGLSGPYLMRATACDEVGNCSSTDERVAMPVRIPASSTVSFRPIAGPARTVIKQTRIRWQSGTRRPHSHRLKLGPSGRRETVTLIKFRRACATDRVKPGRDQHTARRSCNQRATKIERTKRVRYDKRVTVYGQVTSSQGVPIAGVPVRILTAPVDGSRKFSRAATATTDGDGAWKVRLQHGPSRIIRARYSGSARILPASGKATVLVRSRVRIRISPTVVPWGSEVRIRGHVAGGYVPSNSKLLRLDVGIGRIGHIEGLPDIRRDGHFVIVWKFVAGHGVLHPWFAVATLPEAAFPYTPGRSNRVTMTLGKPTPHRHERANDTRAKPRGPGKRERK